MISKMICGCVLSAALASWPVHAAADRMEKTEDSFRFADPKAGNLLIVDNVWGDIRVVGYDGDEVRVRIKKSISNRSDRDISELDKEVFLDVRKEESLFELYVDGPFRDREGHDHRGDRRWRDRDQVRYNFEVEVPRYTNIELSTVNDGEIVVRAVNGDFDIHNVNGGIKMEGIGGSGEVYTVNGDVTVDFVNNPLRKSRFGSLNGDVHLYFLAGLSADFYLKTFNGEIFSDFPVSYLPMEATTSAEKTHGGYVYKVNRETAVRAGAGGPPIELDGFNGDMFILKK